MKLLTASLLFVCSVAAQAQSLTTQLHYLNDIKEYTSLTAALAQPDSVIRLSLKGKKLKEVPPEVFTAFPFLEELNLSRNQLNTLPEALGNLKWLRRLDVSKNKIENLPASIGRCERLEELVVNQNELTTLPDSIGKCMRLRMVDAWSNNIDQLPATMAELKGLEVIDLRVIVMHYDEQKRIRELLPDVKIFMSEGCNCN